MSYGEGEIVDDVFEMKALAQQHKVKEKIKEKDFIKNKIIPKLDMIIAKSDGQITNYQLWPEFDPNF